MPALPSLLSIILPDLRGGGAERVHVDLAREFAGLGHDVEFVVMQLRGELMPTVLESFPVINLETPRARAVPTALARYLRRRRPDVLLSAMWPLTAIAPIARCLSGGRCKVLVSEHNNISLQYREWGWKQRLAIRLSMAVGYRLASVRVGVSEGVVKDISSLSGVRHNAFEVIYNPIAPRAEPMVADISKAEQLWHGPKGSRVLTVGSMKDQKNHFLLLRAFLSLKRPDARLMILGDGPNRGALQNIVQEYGLDGRVIMPGFHVDPTPFYRTADLFVLSSNYEGFGNVIVEALAAGLPVVSTDCPSGPAEILDGGRFGRLTPVGDASALAQAMAAALAERPDRDALKRRAADFAPEIAARKYLAALGLI